MHCQISREHCRGSLRGDIVVRFTQKSSAFVGISVDIFVYTSVCIFVSTFVREFVGRISRGSRALCFPDSLNKPSVLRIRSRMGVALNSARAPRIWLSTVQAFYEMGVSQQSKRATNLALNSPSILPGNLQDRLV